MTRYFCISFAVGVVAASSVWAEAPNLQTPAPVIYLAENLDEPDKLGWCIDTQGRGFGENLHAHSCKPQGGDVQFSFDIETGFVRSVAFPDHCMAYVPSNTSPLGLKTCDITDETQKFEFDDVTGEITFYKDPSLCLTVGQDSRSAGPFVSRSLDMVACDESQAAFKTWRVSQ